MLPYLMLISVFYFWRRSLLVSYIYLTLIYTKQTYKEKHVRDNYAKDISFADFDFNQGISNLINFYTRRHQDIPASDFYVPPNEEKPANFAPVYTIEDAKSNLSICEEEGEDEYDEEEERDIETEN
mmetsp:Transcript_17140/g.12243  ORF Transcript_17140/g.12243 Transcript_17140/m.12243 type:complete len:126 (+) Transcript_17140:817-1194(+)